MARRPTKAERQLRALERQYGKAVADAFRNAMQTAANRVVLAELIRALEVGNIERAINLLRLDDASLFPLSEAVRTSYIAGGASVATALPVTLRAQFGFGGNDRAVRAVQRITGNLIEGIVQESLGAVREAITTGVTQGVPPRALALEITGTMDRTTKTRTGGIMGLNSNQTGAAMRARAELQDLDAGYFQRKLRDRRFDKVVADAIRSGKPLKAADVDKIAGRYKDRLLAHRGKVIARTETLNALRAGQHDGFGSLIDTGAVTADRLAVKWQATSDGRTRDSHTALNGETIRFGQTFTSPATGAQMAHPGDSSLGARGEDTIQCRCVAIYRVLTPKQAAEQ